MCLDLTHKGLTMKKLFSLLLLIAGVGCGPADFTLGIKDAPEWLVVASEGAAAFWDERDIKVTLAPKGDIRIRVDELREGILGEWHPDESAIVVDPSLEIKNIKAKCVVAHEIGHYLGLDHVEEEFSLMFYAARVDEYGNCYWSDSDKAQWDNIH